MLMTLYLAEMPCWLSHCRYWSVCVGFLYTLVDNALSGPGVTSVSREGMKPSGLVYSTVNWIAGSRELTSVRNSSLCSYFCITNMSSVNLFHNLGGA